MKNTRPSLNGVSSFEGIPYKIYKIQARILSFFLGLLFLLLYYIIVLKYICKQ